METKTTTVILGQTATIETYPPALGPPTACTQRLSTPNSSTPAGTTSVTPDSTQTTIAAAAQGATSIIPATFAAITSERMFLLGTSAVAIPIVTTVQQPYLPVTIKPRSAIAASAASAFLKEPLPCAIPSGAPLIGWRMAVALTSDDTARIGEGSVEWTATVLGVIYRWVTRFRVATRDGAYQLNADDLQSLSPYATTARSDDDIDYSRAIAAGWVRYLKPALLAKGIRPERIISWGDLNAVHVAAVELHLATSFEQDQQMRENFKEAFLDALNEAMQSRDLWVSMEELDAVPPDPDAPRPWDVTMIER